MGIKKTKENQKAGSWVIQVPPVFRVNDDQGSQRQFRVDLRFGLLLEWFQREALPLICDGPDGGTIRIVASGSSGVGNTSLAPCRAHFPLGIFIKVIHNQGAPFSDMQIQELQSLAVLNRVGLMAAPHPNLVFFGGWMVDNSPESIALTGSMVSPNIQAMIERNQLVLRRQQGIYVQPGGPFALIISERLNIIWSDTRGAFMEIESGREADFKRINHILSFIVDCARGLQELHRKGLVHNDIKPDNIGGVTTGGRLTFKITDMGLISEGRCDNSGTMGFGDFWNPPEAIHPQGSKKDVYSLGKTILAAMGFFDLIEQINGAVPIPEALHRIQNTLAMSGWFPPQYLASMSHLIAHMLAPERPRRISIDQVLSFVQLMRQGEGEVRGVS